MSDSKRRSLPSSRSPVGKDKNGLHDEHSKVNYFSSSEKKRKTEVNRECEEGWNQSSVNEMDIVKEEITEDEASCSEEDPSKPQSGGTRGSTTTPTYQTETTEQKQKELSKADLPEDKKRKRPQRRQLERAAKLGLTEKDLPESAYDRFKLLAKLEKRKARASETPEKKAERRRREAERKKIQRANEGPEKREKRLKARQEHKKKLRAMNTPEQEARRQKEREQKRKRFEQRAANETPEQREERLKKEKEQRLRINERDRFNRLAKKLTMTEEEKAEERARNFFKKRALEAKMTQEELEAYRERNNKLKREYFKNLSGEKLERHRANVYKAMKRFQERNKERRRRKLEEDPLYRARLRLNAKISHAKQKLKRDLIRDGASEEVIKEELRKLAERMRAEPLPPPEAVSEYKPRPGRRRAVEDAADQDKTEAKSKLRTSFNIEIVSNVSAAPSNCFDESALYSVALPQQDLNINGENPAQEEFNEDNFEEKDYFQEIEDCELPSPEPSPVPELSPVNVAETEEERNEVIASSKPDIQTPILPPVPSPTAEPVRTSTSTGASSSPCSVPNTRDLSQLQPTSIPCNDQPRSVNLNWKCPVCRKGMRSKETFLEHYNSTHKMSRSQKGS